MCIGSYTSTVLIVVIALSLIYNQNKNGIILYKNIKFDLKEDKYEEL